MPEHYNAHHYSVPKRFGERIFLLVIEPGAYSIHRGKHTRLPVVFSRMNDAQRLCDLYNGNAGMIDGVVIPHTTAIFDLIAEAIEELNADYVRRMRRLFAKNKRRKEVAHVS